jgi:hyperosmotically inducible periplasmic protein
MKMKCTTPAGLGRAALAGAMTLALASPVYAADTEPTTSQATTERVAADEAKPADNSAHNARDVAGSDLTPLDQSNDDADVELTRAIRERLVDDDTLGTNAQNVKVITVDGVVTLRGPVENANERARIVAIATEAAGLDRVQNELQVIER